MIKYVFYIDEIKNLLTQFPRKSNYNLTERSYKILLKQIKDNSIKQTHHTYWKVTRDLIERYSNVKKDHFLKLQSLKNMWNTFITQNDREQLLEWTAFYFAQYIQLNKDVSYLHIKTSLDHIANEVMNCLRKKYPNHSIFSTSDETLSYWKNNNINNNHWNEAEGIQIMDTLNEYIFGKLNFRLCKLTDTNLTNMCIDNVLLRKCGQEIILVIIYHSVARRLGLRCDIINLQHSIYHIRYNIFWKPNYVTESLENARCFHIRFKKFPNIFVDQLLIYRSYLFSWWTNSRTTPIKAIEMRDKKITLIKYLRSQSILFRKEIMPKCLV
ncbi:uncharacterized protein LOC114942500 [Nylanderia fulva]|uniref:uncharacterized protein LOC114942500 n=1 Tax=Nylanderia fulva TaxID=613905 RepID=UPI0010FB822E|nr:uncharacterized protein LOC114942500 [Nylanderia fulva]